MNVEGFSGDAFDALRIVTLDPYKAQEDFRSTVRTGAQWTFAVVARYECTPEESALAVRLWNDLPDGEQARCHTPGFAIELELTGETVFTAALCFQCNNASIGGTHATKQWRAFDASSSAAKNLLALCQEAARVSK